MTKPSLGQKELEDKVAERLNELTPEIVHLAVEIILDSIADTLAAGQEVCLRGFGRFIPRHYPKAKRKKIGLLFHPSPRLKEMVGAAERTEERAADLTAKDAELTAP
ncbi:MAG: HU family DNA-binding protein [Deltaproteobacteria bacterium]|nr:HU family DNA-binding protein [Deltaproteobacteria bacterium]